MLKKEFLKLLKEDEEFRHAVAGLIGYEELIEGQKEIRNEIRKLWEEVKSLREESISLRKGQEKLWEEVRGIKTTLGAIGARWGIMSESAFRETLRGLLARELTAKVEKWTYRDDEGYVFGYPAVVDIDIVIKNGRVTVVEVTSHARASDVAALKRKAELYERITGKKVDEVVISSPFLEESAREAAERLGVRVYTAA